MFREFQELRCMERIKEPNNIDSKVLLQPHDIALSPMEHLHNIGVSERLVQLMHPPPDLGRQEVDDEVAPISRRELHKAQEAAIGSVGVVLEVDCDFTDGGGGKVRDEVGELRGGGDVGEWGGETWGRRGGGGSGEDVRGVLEVGYLEVVWMRGAALHVSICLQGVVNRLTAWHRHRLLLKSSP